MPILRSSYGIHPSTPRIVVRWNPVGKTPVEVLFPGDVELAHQIEPKEQRHLDRDVEGGLVDEKRRRVVHFVGAHRVTVNPVDDLLLGLELHERGAVVLAELGERGPHVPEDLRVVFRAVAAGRAPAEQLTVGEDLLVHLKARFEPDRLVVIGRHFFKWLKINHLRIVPWSVPERGVSHGSSGG